LFLHPLLLLASAMVRVVTTALLGMAAFDHFAGDDKGAFFIAAIIHQLFH
jgi:hypothetical protein